MDEVWLLTSLEEEMALLSLLEETEDWLDSSLLESLEMSAEPLSIEEIDDESSLAEEEGSELLIDAPQPARKMGSSRPKTIILFFIAFLFYP